MAVVAAAIASLAAIALLLIGSSGGPVGKDVQAALTVLSVALAWAAVHSIFTARNARLYYTGAPTAASTSTRQTRRGTATSPTWPSPSG